jgi:hypothetical protein
MKRFSITVVIVLLYVAVTTAQTPSISIGNDSVCAAREVVIPVSGKNLVNIGAITLYIGIDTTALTYLSLRNINSQLTGMNYNFNTNPVRIAIAWSGISGINYPDTKLFDIVLHSNGDISPITFLQGCDITDVNLVKIPVNFQNGGVASASPVLTLQPYDTEVTEGKNISIAVSSPNATGYSWSESRDNGITWNVMQDGASGWGTHSSVLHLIQVPYTLNGSMFVCHVERDGCFTISNTAKLFVDTLLAAGQLKSNDGFELYQNQPNPFSESTTIPYTLSQPGWVNMRIIDVTGTTVQVLVNQFTEAGNHSVTVKSNNLPSGVYYYNLEFRNNLTKFAGCKKMVRVHTN